MNWGGLGRIFHNISGEPEIGRSSLGLGIFATVTTPIVFQSLDMYHNGWHFDAAVWCVVYPAGICALIAGGVLAVASKDKSVAQARVIVAQPPLDDKTGTP